jgi:hypothetical protein
MEPPAATVELPAAAAAAVAAPPKTERVSTRLPCRWCTKSFACTMNARTGTVSRSNLNAHERTCPCRPVGVGDDAGPPATPAAAKNDAVPPKAAVPARKAAPPMPSRKAAPPMPSRKAAPPMPFRKAAPPMPSRKLAPASRADEPVYLTIGGTSEEEEEEEEEEEDGDDDRSSARSDDGSAPRTVVVDAADPSLRFVLDEEDAEGVFELSATAQRQQPGSAAWTDVCTVRGDRLVRGARNERGSDMYEAADGSMAGGAALAMHLFYRNGALKYGHSEEVQRAVPPPLREAANVGGMVYLYKLTRPKNEEEGPKDAEDAAVLREVLPRLLHATLTWLGGERWSVCVARLVFPPHCEGHAGWPVDGVDEARALECCLALSRLGFAPAGPRDSYWLKAHPGSDKELPQPATLTMQDVASRIEWPLPTSSINDRLVLRTLGSQHTRLALLPPRDALLCLAVSHACAGEQPAPQEDRAEDEAPVPQTERDLELIAAAVDAGGSVDATCALHRAIPAAARSRLTWHETAWVDARVRAIDPKDSARLCAVLRCLLRAGGAATHADAATGDTPLHVAAAAGDADVARLLLQAGAQRDARNAYGKTPAHLAAQRLSRMSAAALRDDDASLPTIQAVTALLALLTEDMRWEGHALIGGLLTPRMHYRLLERAEYMQHDLESSIGRAYQYQGSKTMVWPFISAERVARLEHTDVLPPSVLRDNFPHGAAKSFVRCVEAVARVLAARQLPTLEALTACLEAGGSGSRAPSIADTNNMDEFKRLGGSPLHGLAAVLFSARNTSATHGDGWFDYPGDEDEDEDDEDDGGVLSHDKRMRTLPYMTLLEDDYALLYATLVGPQLDCNSVCFD